VTATFTVRPMFAVLRCASMLLLSVWCGCGGEEPSKRASVSPGEWPVLLSVDGDRNNLGDAHDAALLSDGSLVIAHAGEQEVLWFDQEGRLVRRFGRRGSGPGEFRDLNSILATRDDTVLAYDGRLSRLTVLSGSGELVRTHRLPSSVGPAAKLVGWLEGGRLLFLRETIPMPRARAEGLVTDSSSLVVVDPSSGEHTQDLGNVPLRNIVVDGSGAALFVMSSPYPSTASIGACGDSIMIAFGDTNVFEWRLAKDGGARRSVPVSLQRAPTTRAEVDSLLATSSKGGRTDLTEHAKEALVHQSGQLRRPLFSRAALDVDGSVWILVDSIEKTGSEWRNVDADGHWTDLPPIRLSGRILQMTRSKVLMHSRDDAGLDVFHVLSRLDPWPADHCSRGLSGTVTASLIG